MTPFEQLQAILNERYTSEDGDEYKIELKPGLKDQEIDELANQLPTGKIPEEIDHLLRFSSGFEFYGLEEITFDGVGQFGFEEFFPTSIRLAADGYGNFWILDISNNGQWGNVFYVCHDPAVIVKHSENLAEFILHVDEFGKKGDQSNLDIIHEITVNDIWTSNNGFVAREAALKSSDDTLKSFAATLPDHFVIADLRANPVKSGFAWGKFGPHIGNAKRYDSELLWGVEKLVKKGFLERLLGK